MLVPAQWVRLTGRLNLPPQASRFTVPSPVHGPRSGVSLPSDARQNLRFRLASWSHVYVLPVERYAGLIDRTAAPPPQPMHQGEVPPPDLEEA